MTHSITYPDARYLTVEVDLTTGSHQLLHFVSLSHAQCINHCQCRGPVEPTKHRLILLTHKTAD